MPFSPIDLQVSFQQAGRVADESVAANETKKQARSDRADEAIERRRLQENTLDEIAESNSIDGRSTGNAGGYHSSSGEEEESEESADKAVSEDPSKGSFIDLTT